MRTLVIRIKRLWKVWLVVASGWYGWASFILLLLVAGCASHQTTPDFLDLNYSLSAFFDPQTINTVVVMPLENRTQIKKIEEAVREELILQLIKTDRYNIVDRYLLRELLEAQGVSGYDLDSRLVKRIESQFHADAILLGKVTQYTPATVQWRVWRRPPVIGLSLRLVSVKTGQTLWTVHHTFDGGDRVLQARATPAVRPQISRDITALTQVACAEIAKTLNF